jgi:hypothetical protein
VQNHSQCAQIAQNSRLVGTAFAMEKTALYQIFSTTRPIGTGIAAPF